MAAPSLLPKILCFLACSCSCSLSFAHSSSPQNIADLHDSCPDLLTLSSQSSAPRDSGTLLLAVPWKLGFEKFISFSPRNCNITGFSIDVFRSALPHLQDHRLQSCRLVLVGDGTQTPSYDHMIEMVRDKIVDGLVGDFTITKDRSDKVGFTVPYLASYLVMVAPSRFTSLCIFGSQQESVQTHLGRIVTGMWIFAMLIFTAGYTASLTSFLSAQKRYPTIEGFQALLRDRSITVGCQEGSFMENYMRQLNLMEHKIIKFNSTKQYLEALHKGNDSENGVGAVLEEVPYIRELVQSHPCDLMKSSRGDDHLPSFGGLGFAFRHGDALIDQLSKIILQMASNGTLKKLQKKWQIEHIKDTKCELDASLSHMGLKSFAGLFSVVSAVYLICVSWHLLKTKPIKTPKQSCAPIHALSCSQDESAIDRQAGDLSLIRGENRACDAVLEINQVSNRECSTVELFIRD